MPIPKGRGKVVRVRTRKVGRDGYQVCEVLEKPGPRGGKTVCGPVKKKKKR